MIAILDPIQVKRGTAIHNLISLRLSTPAHHIQWRGSAV